jgi:hypothetical protein
VEGHPESSRTLTDACQRAGFRPRIDFEGRDQPRNPGVAGAAFLPCLGAAARDLRAAAPGPGPSAPGS